MVAGKPDTSNPVSCRSLGKRTPVPESIYAESLCSLSSPRKLRSPQREPGEGKLREFEGILFSDERPDRIIEKLRTLYDNNKEMREQLSTQEESVQEDTDLCNFEIITSSDFL